MKIILTVCLAILFFPSQVFAQIPTPILVSIVKAEDERRYDKVLEDLMKNQTEPIRLRAARAAGRIGDERAIATLVGLLEKDSDAVRATAAFALGEIESVKTANQILKHLADEKLPAPVRARLTEAAGKIAAANAKDKQAVELGAAILNVLDAEIKKPKPDRTIILLGLTAILRARPEAGEVVAAKFLTSMDGRIRSDAANTLSRIRAKNANEPLRAMLLADSDANARANAARALGAAEDALAFDLLLEAAVSDEDSRVRVSATRSLGSLKDKRAADKLLKRGEILLKEYKKEFYEVAPSAKNELLEIAATLGRILANSDDGNSLDFLSDFGVKDSYNSPEIHIAIARISPSNFLKINVPKFICNANYARITPSCWQFYSGRAQGFGEFANLDANKSWRNQAADILRTDLKSYKKSEFATDQINVRAIPDILRAFSNFKTDDLPEILRDFLKYNDVSVRAAAAELLGETKSNEETVEAFSRAFEYALKNDKQSNDAQLAILDAFAKLDKNRARGILLLALHESDYLVRRKAIQLIRANDLANADDVGLLFQTELAERERNTVRPFNEFSRSKQGVILNTTADYTRAVSRKNARAILTTDKGIFTIEFTPEAAPLTVDNFIKLAKANYFNGLAIHRVVPNFVMQDGDPRGDGNGGPGYSIRCEINTETYERGAVGMALSGKDTGGSQWFVTHAAQSHLDGGYTVFGRVNETEMKIVDNLVRGDVIRSVKIVESNSSPKNIKNRKR